MGCVGELLAAVRTQSKCIIAKLTLTGRRQQMDPSTKVRKEETKAEMGANLIHGYDVHPGQGIIVRALRSSHQVIIYSVGASQDKGRSRITRRHEGIGLVATGPSHYFPTTFIIALAMLIILQVTDVLMSVQPSVRPTAGTVEGCMHHQTVDVPNQSETVSIGPLELLAGAATRNM